MLKEKYGIGHGYANMVVHKAKETGAASSADDELVTEQYKGKEATYHFPYFKRLRRSSYRSEIFTCAQGTSCKPKVCRIV